MAQDEDVAEPTRPNMTPMIDVVFQLIVFFLVSMRFRSLDELIPSPLREGGAGPGPRPPTLHLALSASAPGSPVRVTLDRQELGSAEGSRSDPVWTRLADRFATVRQRAAEAGAPPVRIEVDASPSVAAGMVLAAVDAAKGAGISEVVFRGTPP